MTEPETSVLSSTIDVNRLPTLPAIAMEAIRLMEGEHSSFSSVADLLQNDQVLASRILHYANTAYVSSRKISSIDQAIALLGFNAVRSIILSATIFASFSKKVDPQREKPVKFWLHSVGVAVTAEALAGRLGFPSPDEAYLAGLIHDIGKLVAYLQRPADFAALCEEIDRQGSFSVHGPLPLDLEKGFLGTTHMEMGRQAAEHWRFPENLVNAIWLHHQPVSDTIVPESENLGALLRFADVLCVSHNIGSSYLLTEGSYSHEHFHFALENMMLHHSISPAEVDALMAATHDRVKALGTVLGFWDEDEYRKLVTSANVSLGSASMVLERNNRELGEANRVMDASCTLVRELHARMGTQASARVINEHVQRAFGVDSSLCLIRDEERQVFTGSWLQHGMLQEMELPVHLIAMEKYASLRGGAMAEIEQVAIERLRQVTAEAFSGKIPENGLAGMLAGARFMATFFTPQVTAVSGREAVYGMLLIDFGGVGVPGEGAADLHRRFGTFALTASSIVERLLLERHLSRQADKLAEASRKMEENQRQLFHSHRLATVGQLAAGAAHEINNPLTIISLNVQFLKNMARSLDDGGATGERLEIVASQVQRISKIIQEMMGFARPSQPRFATARVEEILDRVLKVLGDRVCLRNISVASNLAHDLPEVMVDALQIEQVFMNLLINASHAMPKGGSIAITAANSGKMVDVAFADTGTGIDPKHLSRIFDPFFTTKKEGEGSGLGLAICNTIVEHNGGTIRVQSALGKGTTFTVSLPVDKGGRLRALKESIKESRPAAPVRRNRHRILVIDDEHLLNDMLQETLRDAGYEVDGAYDGVEGISQLRFRKYDLILLDIRMPRKDGLEVLQFVREEFPEVKVVIITGLASKKEIADTVGMGAFACLKKPFMLEKVLETIRKALPAVPE
ncbi:MAG: HDOD domain-containing protein [Thermodesulfobacteriota bacterium]